VNGESMKAVGYDGAIAVDDSDAEDEDEWEDEWEDALDDGAFCEKMIRLLL
jgi:hypothetical protein